MNRIKCSFCGINNFILNYRCTECGTIIREKINNINLGDALKNLLFNIEFGIKQILYAEHKNYLFVLLVFFCLKATIVTLYEVSFIDFESSLKVDTALMIIFLFWFVFVLVLALIFKSLLKFFFQTKIKYKDSLTVLVYPFIYFSLSLILVFPLELMLFGKYLFSNNPSIFEINLGKAIAITTLEVLLILYSFYLLFNFLVFILHIKLNALFLTLFNIILLYIGNEVLKKIIGIN